MYQQIAIALFLNIRVYIGIVFTGAILMLSSMVVTAAGSNTVLDARKHPTISTYSSDMADSPNAVTAASASMVEHTRYATLSLGRSLYQGCHTVTVASATAGRSVARGTVAAVHSTANGIAVAARAVGSGVMYTVRLPGKLLAPITQARAVNSFIRPADSIAAPVISSQTSSELLAQYNEQQRQQFAKLLEAQATANKELGGSALSGDATHGGYPAKWNNIRQDATIDSWGMYNRECVSYAAWKVHQTYGNMPYWGGVGNANQWVANAHRSGIPTSSTPKVHSVAISMQGYYGHAMWVEAIKGDMIYVSQYNYDLRGQYSEMWIKSTNLTYIYFN